VRKETWRHKDQLSRESHCSSSQDCDTLYGTSVLYSTVWCGDITVPWGDITPFLLIIPGTDGGGGVFAAYNIEEEGAL